MLGSTNAVAMLAVRDLANARRFYQDTLGLTPVDAQGEEVIVFRSGDTNINVYRSKFAGSNQATALTWSVGARLDEVVRQLQSKGVAFQHYDMPGLKCEGDIYRHENMRVAWFKDPDGNILSVIDGG